MTLKALCFHIGVFLLWTVITPISLVSANDFPEEMAQADHLMENGQYLEAIAAYQAIADNADETDMRARAILRIGDVYGFFLNNYDLALNKYWLIKRDFPQTTHVESAYFNSGMIYYERRRYKEALQQFRTYIKNYPRGGHRETAAFMIEACLKPGTYKGTADTHRMQAGEVPQKVPGNVVRVMIAANAPEVRLMADWPFTVHDVRNKGPGAYSEVLIQVVDGTLYVNETRMAGRELIIRPNGRSRVLSVNGKPYRGLFTIQTGNRQGLNVINTLDIESYLYGVIPKEMSPQWPLEALKAQSVAARSFALYQKAKNKDKAYDVASSTGSQVYGGYSVETVMTNRAVDETQGVVMMYDGQPALAYFHANSGGTTEDAKNVWTAEIPYLKSVPDLPSAKAPNTCWSVSLKRDVIRQSLNKHGIRISDITGLRPIRKSPSGRVTQIAISSAEGNMVMDGNDFRLKVDPTVIRSTLFTILPPDEHDDESIRFQGKGFGHGVGMSQWGAVVMAREGHTYRDILSHYYSGIAILKP